jgi:hypothetical protein
MGVPETLSTSNADSVLDLQAQGLLSVGGARELQNRLLEALSPERDLSISIDADDRLDMAGLQLLLATQVWLSAHGRKLVISAAEGPALRALLASGAPLQVDIRSSVSEATTSSKKDAHP